MNPPFVASDACACHPACVAMALSALGRPCTLARAKALCGFVPGAPTWHFQSYLGLAASGLTVEVIDPLDHRAFARDPLGYLSAELGEADAAALAQETDLNAAAQAAAQVVDAPGVVLQERLATLDDLKAALDDGALALCPVDQGVYRGLNRVIPHTVLVYGWTKSGVTLHDPGPPKPGLRLPFATFEAAWASPDPHLKALITVRRA